MKVGYVSIHSVVQDYLDITGEDVLGGKNYGGVKEELILKWANDAIERMNNDVQYVHKVDLLRIENYKAEIPPGFKYVAQASYRRIHESSQLRDRITEWSQKALDGSGCKLDISIDCPKCHETTCDCKTSPIVEVDVNRIYQDAHPELYTKYMAHFFHHGSLNDRGEMTSCMDPDFVLMRRTSNSYFNIPYHIGNCLNLNADIDVEYDISLPHIITNFSEGEVLLSYIGEKLDEDGYRMIPDLPVVHEAITIAVDERMAYRRWRLEGNPSHRVDWQTIHALKEKLIARGRSQLQIPDPDAWHQYIRNHWKQLIPKWNWREDFNRFRPDRFNYGDYYATNSTNRHHTRHSGRAHSHR